MKSEGHVHYWMRVAWLGGTNVYAGDITRHRSQKIAWCADRFDALALIRLRTDGAAYYDDRLRVYHVREP